MVARCGYGLAAQVAHHGSIVDFTIAVVAVVAFVIVQRQFIKLHKCVEFVVQRLVSVQSVVQQQCESIVEQFDIAFESDSLEGFYG